MKKILLISIPVFLIGYILLACLPYRKQGGITENTAEEFHMETFYGDEESGERAGILFSNEDALEKRMQLIVSAKNRIVLSTFDFRADNSGRLILSALYDAAQRGVNVEILIDGYSFFTLKSGKEYFKALGSLPEVTIKIYNPVNFIKPHKLMARMHDKYLIADDEAYILGGRNTYDYFLGDDTDYKNYDWDVLVCKNGTGEPASLRQLNTYFSTVWELPDCKITYDTLSKRENKQVEDAVKELQSLYADCREKHPEWFTEVNLTEETVPVNKITLLHNPVQTSIKEPVLFYEMTELMRNAGEGVTFHTPYVMCNDYMMERLEGICEKCPVVMLTNSVANNGNPFGAVDYQIHKQELLNVGLSILEYDSGVSYHGKCFRIGERLTGIGSFNWDMRSTYLDTELMLVIDSKELGAEMDRYKAYYEEEALTVQSDGSYRLQDGQSVRELSGKRKRRVILIRPFDRLFRFLM